MPVERLRHQNDENSFEKNKYKSSVKSAIKVFLSRDPSLPAIQFDITSNAWKHFFTLFYHCSSPSVWCMNVNGAAAYLCISYARIEWFSMVPFRFTTAKFIVVIVVDKHLIIFGFRIEFHLYICATVLLKPKNHIIVASFSSDFLTHFQMSKTEHKC